jgi:flagellar hook-associated protein 3 FlgL
MRISTSYQFDVQQQQVSRTNSSYFEAQQRVSTGKRINSISDDPSGFGNVVSMRSVKAGLSQYDTNLARANTVLKTTENVFAETNSLLQRANALAVSGASSGTTQEARKAMATEIGTIRNRVLELANTKSANGEYIFAGTATDKAPFQLTAAGPVYQGNTSQLQVEAAPGQLMNLSVNGQQLFTDAYTRLDSLKSAMEGGNPADIGNNGIKNMQTSVSDFNSARGDIGTRLQSVESRRADHTRRTEELTKNVSDIEDVDLSKAILDYKSAETAYQGALQVASQGFRLSLLDFIR